MKCHINVSEYVLHKAEAVSYFLPIAMCTILMTFIMMLVTCAW